MSVRGRGRRAPIENAAVRAEPRGIGTAGARDPLAREVRLLGALLGQVIAEQAGAEVLDLVESVRRSRIERRKGDRAGQAAGAPTGPGPAAGGAPSGSGFAPGPPSDLEAVPDDQVEPLIRAFTIYFGLVNLAEERHRVRTLRERERAARGGPIDGSIASAVDLLANRGHTREEVELLVGALSIAPVLTAHPTEARRRTLLVALRRCAGLIERLDDPRLTPGEDADLRRRLREEITVLWRTSAVRSVTPTPLDEVRAAMVFFDETIYSAAPPIHRALDAALDRLGRGAAGGRGDAGRTGTRPTPVRAVLRWGSWVGGDRDGNPNVTAETTLQAIRIQADHVVRGHEAVASRLMQSTSVTVPVEQVPSAIAIRLAGDEEAFPETMRQLRQRFPEEPYRQRLGAMAERLRRTRAWLTGSPAPLAGRYAEPAELLEEIREIQSALIAAGLGRVAWGEIQDLLWRVETFGFHFASLEVRQHADVHARALERLRAARASAGEGGSLDPRLLLALSTDEVVPGVTATEVLATFRAMAMIQARFGEEACRRYVISFTSAPADVARVLELAALAGDPAFPAAATAGFPPGTPVLDVVPLFESADALGACAGILGDLLEDPGYRAHLAGRGDRQEIMLGYSDSNKESGFLAANWMLQRAQSELAAVADRRAIELTLFHGRGGAIGRGGGPTARAIGALAPGSLRGRLKLTEQGEVIAAHYADPAIARRELELMTGAVLVASTPEHEADLAAVAREGFGAMEELALDARAAYRALVWDDPAFAAFFREATPIGELSDLRLGSRPAARGRLARDRAPSIADLRAIPWVFAWSQSRVDLPGWYGLGSALAAYEARHGSAGLDRLRSLYARWPFLASLLDNAERVLARVDLPVARRYASLAEGGEAARIMALIEAEHERSVASLLRVTGRSRLLEAAPALRRSIDLRNPYIDPLSELQVRLLARLRALPESDPARSRLLRLVQLTVSGIAAGLQNTG